ncbi:MAG: V-type ATPase subunit [Candidatus Thermoplasmatota archaeon]|nr:V-type ATPase subunit [Candidatus Thermoplasmatota archaeon]
MFDVLLDPHNYPFWVLVIALIAGAIAVIARPFFAYLKFVYPNAKYEAIGNPFLRERELQKPMESKTLEDFKETINTNKDYNIQGETTKEIQQSLDKSYIQTIEMMKKDSSKKMNDFFDLFIEKNDIQILKLVLKQKIFNQTTVENISKETVLPKYKTLIENLINSSIEEIPLTIKEFPDYIVKLFSEKEISPLKIDQVFDRYFIERFKKIKVPYKCNQAKNQFVKTLVDHYNIKNVLRAKKIGYNKEDYSFLFMGEGLEIASWKFNEIVDAEEVPEVISTLEGTSYFDSLKDSVERFTKEGTVQVLENALDAQFLSHVKNLSLKNYGTIGPTLRFIISKEFEIRNLKIISKGISEHLSSDIMKKWFVLETAS